ncbi:L10-interacting MYB domain-containing protein [Actinidia chinensis var. chinensis]|uniref:L10-interacting MYB domain-containing protein n=1 Tax=Actinidia chinensis var. chinensis TaxID=1590841 RepID=A0A2R6PZM0_ACTCC|nr:L10-interacting MYB domain-containing protein [Actinidia chinensis var. chinensis]
MIGLISSHNIQMDGEGSERQPKQERLRTRWTSSLDKIFADLVVEQIQQGNRTNNVFDKKTWNLIRDEFNRRTDLHFNNNQLRKHLDVLRTRYYSVKSSFDQNDFVIDDSCCIGFDLWEDIGAQTKPDATKGKECPIYDQLCTIFADSGADGKYAQSSHYEELHKSLGTENPTKLISCPDNGTPRSKTPLSSKFAQGNAPAAQNTSKNVAERKRKRSEETVCISGQTKSDQEINETMAKALSDMLAASKLRAVAMPEQDDRFNITNCIKALDEIEATEGIDSRLYFAALDLFEDPNLRETFVSLKSNKIRLTWLQGKCGSAISN